VAPFGKLKHYKKGIEKNPQYLKSWVIMLTHGEILKPFEQYPFFLQSEILFQIIISWYLSGGLAKGVAAK
jgi:hypothetical protein